MFYCLLALQATICSTAFTPGALVIAADFKISTELALCTLTLFVSVNPSLLLSSHSTNVLM